MEGRERRRAFLLVELIKISILLDNDMRLNPLLFVALLSLQMSGLPLLASDWIPVGNTIDINGRFGWVNIDLNSNGDVVAIGAWQAGATQSGETLIYKLINGSWQQLGASIFGAPGFDPDPTSGPGAASWSGCSLSLSDDGLTIAVGEKLYSGAYYRSGRTRVFNYNGSNWVQKGDDLLGESGEDWGGGYVSLSGDGNTLLVGYPRSNSTLGYAKLFKYSNNEWVQYGETINSLSSDIEACGYFVKLSNDGSTFIVSSPYYNEYRGAIRIYSILDNGVIELRQTIYGNLVNRYFGTVVSTNYDGSIIGVSESGGQRGNARIYTRNGLQWEQSSEIPQMSGARTVLNDSGLIAFASDNTNAQLFAYENSSWTPLGANLPVKYGIALNASGDRVATSESITTYRNYVKVYTNLEEPSPPSLELESRYFYNSENANPLTLSATPEGFPRDFTYQWFFEGTPILASLGGNESSYSLPLSSEYNGIYSVTVDNSIGTTTESFYYLGYNSTDSRDTDNDSLSDYDEITTHSSDPLLPDTSGDGLLDGFVVNSGFDPNTDYTALLDSRPTQTAYDTVVSERNSRLTVNEIKDARIGSTMIEVSGGKADITLSLEEASDLNDWSNPTTSEKTIQADAPSGTRFYRFKMTE